MTERDSYIRCTTTEKETIAECIREEFDTEPGSGVATGTAIAYLCEKAVSRE